MRNNWLEKIKEIWKKYPEINALSFDPVIDDSNSCYSFDVHLDNGVKTYWIEFHIEAFDPKFLLAEIDNDVFQSESFRDYCFELKVKGERIREFIFDLYKSMDVFCEDELSILVADLIKIKKINLKNLFELEKNK